MKLENVCRLLFLMLVASATFASAQDVKVKGTAYLDYYYVVSDDADEAAEGLNGFANRRMYLTTDFGVTDKISARFRLEASGSSTTAQGSPSPFVKDLYVKFKDIIGKGHDLYAGISGPPSFSVSEDVWAYRSLEKTIMDRVKVVSSRDFGVSMKGRFNEEGKIRYGIMFANNGSVKDETNKYKRGYAQLEFYPTDAITATVGADYAAGSGGSSATNLNGFLGYEAKPVVVGLEGFYLTYNEGDAVAAPDKAYDAPGSILSSDADRYGVSAFARFMLNDKWEAVARYDMTAFTEGDVSESFILGGLSYNAHKGIQIIPNVIIAGTDDGSNTESSVIARLTLHANI